MRTRVGVTARLMTGPAGALLAVALLSTAATASSGAFSVSWVSDVRVHSASSAGQDHPDAAMFPNGTMIVVWEDFTDGSDPNIFAQLIDAAGARKWTSDLNLSQGANAPEWMPRVATDLSGEAVVVFTRRVGGSDFVFAQKIRSDGSLGWGLGGVQVNAPVAVSDARDADVANNGDDTWVVVWTFSGGTGREVLAQELGVSGTRQWGPADKPVNQFSTQDQDRPRVVRNASGGSIVVWVDSRLSGSPNAVFAQALNGSGDPTWGPADVQVTQNATSGIGSVIDVSLGSGNTYYVAWDQFRVGASQLFGQRLSATGVPSWGTEDRLLAGDGVLDATNPSLALDTTADAGELLVAWDQCGDVSCSDSNITARLFDAAGAPLWPSNLTVNQFRPGFQQWTSAVFDPVGSSYFVAYNDERAGGDIYAQHFDESGVVPEVGGPAALVVGLALSLALIVTTNRSLTPRSAVFVRVRSRAFQSP